MPLIEQTVKGFTEELCSSSPAPGGGSTAALEASLGAALLHMAASLTAGKAKYAEHSDYVNGLLEKTEKTRLLCLEIIDRDTEAFNGMSAVFAMPKATEEEKKAREKAKQDAFINCTKPPLDLMRHGVELLEAAKEVHAKTNTNAASDVGVAALSLKAAVQGAGLNVLINTAGMADRAPADKLNAEALSLMSRAETIADAIYNAVLNSLK